MVRSPQDANPAAIRNSGPSLADDPRLVVEPEPELQSNLPIRNLLLLNATAGFDDLKPIEVMKGFRSFRDRGLDHIFDTSCRRAGQFNLFVDVFAHKTSLLSDQCLFISG